MNRIDGARQAIVGDLRQTMCLGFREYRVGGNNTQRRVGACQYWLGEFAFQESLPAVKQ